jgi:hypothetical protein
VPSPSASGQEAAAAAAEEATKKAADALKEFSGPGIETEPGGSGLDGGTGEDKDGDGKPDSLLGEDKDGDGKPDSPLGEDKDGDGKPDSPLGEDKDGDDNPDTLKVKQGDKTFEMTEPDHDGKMDIKVGDGSGPLKDFKLDWSDDAKAGDGPQGTDDVHCPGPDGKIHIEDGGVKITAERPDGPDGPTVVTVDDGSGTPTTYTLGEDDKDGPKHLLDDTLGGDDKKDVLGDTPSSPAHSVKTDDLPTHSGTLDGIGAGGGGGGGHELSAAGLGAGAGVGVAAGGGLGEAPSLSEGIHSGVGANQQQPVTAGFAPSAAGAPGASGQSMGGGMAPMGGMGGGGAGGGDQERTNRAYRIEGAVFEPMAEPTGRIMGSLDDEEPPVIRRR